MGKKTLKRAKLFSILLRSKDYISYEALILTGLVKYSLFLLFCSLVCAKCDSSGLKTLFRNFNAAFFSHNGKLFGNLLFLVANDIIEEQRKSAKNKADSRND